MLDDSELGLRGDWSGSGSALRVSEFADRAEVWEWERGIERFPRTMLR